MRNKLLILIAIMLIFTMSLIASASAVEVLVTRFADNSVSHLDIYSGETKKIKVGEGPNKISITPDKKLAVVTNTKEGSISIIDIENLKQIKKIKVADEPIGVQITPDGLEAYVASSQSNKIHVIDLVNLVGNKTIEVGEVPIGIAFTNERAYITNLADSSIDVIDRETKRVIDTIKDPTILTSPGDIAISSDGKIAYIVDTKYNKIIKLDMEKNRFLPDNLDTMNTNINNELIVGNRLALLSANGDEDSSAIQVIDLTKNEVTLTIPLDGEAFGMDFADGALIVVKEEGLELIDIKNNEKDFISIGDKPKDVVIVSRSTTTEPIIEPEEKEKEVAPDQEEGAKRSPVKVIIVVIIIFIILIILFRGKRDETKEKKSKKKSESKKKIEAETPEEKKEQTEEKAEKTQEKAPPVEEKKPDSAKEKKAAKAPKESKPKKQKKAAPKKQKKTAKPAEEKPAETISKEEAKPELKQKEPEVVIEKIKTPEKPKKRRKKYKVQKTKSFVDELLDEDIEKQNPELFKEEDEPDY
ncbi:hypothetical protein KY340_01780 [Candidatus Woesearchaeota archaeon]|nr:hypothetical protein [Candidatus Woesearchaeota archaeon]